jgi:hypothetical protein
MRVFGRLSKFNRFVNLAVTNVPGPPYFMGAELLEAFPIPPTAGNMSFMVAALSYNGQFNVSLSGDPQTCPDLAVLAEGLRRCFAEPHPVQATASAS